MKKFISVLIIVATLLGVTKYRFVAVTQAYMENIRFATTQGLVDGFAVEQQLFFYVFLLAFLFELWPVYKYKVSSLSLVFLISIQVILSIILFWLVAVVSPDDSLFKTYYEVFTKLSYFFALTGLFLFYKHVKSIFSLGDKYNWLAQSFRLAISIWLVLYMALDLYNLKKFVAIRSVGTETQNKEYHLEANEFKKYDLKSNKSTRYNADYIKAMKRKEKEMLEMMKKLKSETHE